MSKMHHKTVMKHFNINGNYQTKTLCRETRLAEAVLQQTDAAEAACVSDNYERDAT